MARSALSISQMGEDVCWMLVKQAMGIPNAKMPSDFLTSKVALMLFARASLPERLCCTAAFRQMGGTTIYQGGSNVAAWRAEAQSFQTHLMPILDYFLDCLYIYGYDTANPHQGQEPDFPIINAGCADGHPAHALADMACMLRVAKKLEGVTAAWIGCVNGTLHSLLEAMVWFPFSMAVSLPPESGEQELIRQQAASLKIPVKFVDSPEAAVKGASFVFAGRKPEHETPENAAWALTDALLEKADPRAKILLSATPLRAIPVAKDLLAGRRSMLVKQAEYRLCVHKRILHWVFGMQ